jgi:outer membrane receptor protein involved in Fe transport
MKHCFTAFLIVLLAGIPALAQGTVTGSLTGRVTTEGTPLPGATITVTSPQLQGSRTAYSDENGNYNIAALPPGDYTVTISLEGLQTATQQAHVSVSGTARVDANLRVSAVTEAITVTASAPAVLETTEVESNFRQQDVNLLPVGRNPNAIANLAPGVTNNGPGGTMQISGAMAADNLIMVNGAAVQDNVRGTTRPLYIEDAIQETTVLTAGVSAEYGNFTGGVVNTITRSGGNEFSGSFRDSLSNPRWTAVSAANEARPDDTINNIYEATLGGYVMKDRLWFFGAARQANTSGSSRFATLNQQPSVNITSDQKNLRWEGKLTGQIAKNHSIILNYLDNPLEFTNDTQINPWELSAVDPSAQQNEDFRAIIYNGIFSSNLFGEALWNRRRFTFVGFGGDNPDLFGGTPLRSFFSDPTLNGISNAPWFCGVCADEHRDSERAEAKLTYFLGTKGFGSHNIVGGVQRYNEFMLANNYQSASGLTVWMYNTPPVVMPDGTVQFTWGPGDSVESFRVENPSLGSDLTTDSVFINDKWDLNANFSFNLGLRYDQTDAVNQAGDPTVDESSFSPRLGVAWDPQGNGKWRLSATYGRYVGRLAEGVQGAASNAGDPNWYGWYYEGDQTFTGTAAEVVRHAVQWWQANGGFDLGLNPPTASDIGGVTTQLRQSLRAPGMDEWTVGAGWQFSNNGYIRGDLIHRVWNNLYAAFTNQETGQVTQPSGFPADLTLVGNTNDFERNYNALQLQASDRFFDRVNVGGSYTLSKLRGNIEGETSGSGPVTTGGWIFQYPEYQGFAQNAPVGYLAGDQRHKVRLWAGFDVPLGPGGTLNISGIERYDSGSPYSAVAVISPRANPAAGDVSGAYASPPVSVNYYIGERGRFRWDDVTRTDLALNYRLPIGGFELFAEGEVFNVFNEQAQIGGSTSVITSRNSTQACHNSAGAPARCLAFNPFSETPVEGVNYAFGSTFGQTTGNPAEFQLPRTYQFSLGARF